MKDTASHRKRNKSESDSVKTNDNKESHQKEGHHKGVAKEQNGPQHPGRRISQNKMDAPQHPGRRISQHKMDAAQHPGRRISQHKMDAPQHGGRRISQYKMGRHEHSDHEHHDDYHHSASSHPIRPRRDTMLSRGGHSFHHESDRRSVGTNELATPVVFYENTYKLTPDCRFHEGKVRDIIRAVLKENITEKAYDPNMCGQKCQLISEIIKERVKTLDMPRFKIVCMVMIGQENEQSMIVTSRCLWDHRFDNSISVEFKQGDIIAVGLVFAVYTE